MLGSISFGGSARRYRLVREDIERIAGTMNDGIDRVEALEQRVKEHEVTLWVCIFNFALIAAILWLIRRKVFP